MDDYPSVIDELSERLFKVSLPLVGVTVMLRDSFFDEIEGCVFSAPDVCANKFLDDELLQDIVHEKMKRDLVNNHF